MIDERCVHGFTWTRTTPVTRTASWSAAADRPAAAVAPGTLMALASTSRVQPLALRCPFTPSVKLAAGRRGSGSAGAAVILLAAVRPAGASAAALLAMLALASRTAGVTIPSTAARLSAFCTAMPSSSSARSVWPSPAAVVVVRCSGLLCRGGVLLLTDRGRAVSSWAGTAPALAAVICWGCLIMPTRRLGDQAQACRVVRRSRSRRWRRWWCPGPARHRSRPTPDLLWAGSGLALLLLGYLVSAGNVRPARTVTGARHLDAAWSRRLPWSPACHCSARRPVWSLAGVAFVIAACLGAAAGPRAHRAQGRPQSSRWSSGARKR